MKLQTVIDVLSKLIPGKHTIEKSSLGYSFLVFHDLSHKKAINILLKNGFKQCLNENYISLNDLFIKKTSSGLYKKVFMINVSSLPI